MNNDDIKITLNPLDGPPKESSERQRIETLSP